MRGVGLGGRNVATRARGARTEPPIARRGVRHVEGPRRVSFCPDAEGVGLEVIGRSPDVLAISDAPDEVGAPKTR